MAKKLDATPAPEEHPFAPFVRILGKGKTGSRSLNREEARAAMSMILNREVEDIQLGAFLMLLRVKEESADEMTGFVEAVQAQVVDFSRSIHVDLDWSSYAGKKRHLPWYLLAALALSDSGIRIVMHGARGHTAGRLYSEDILQQLGVPVAQSFEQLSSQLDDSQFGFISLQHIAPRLQEIIDFRNQFGLRSPVHTLSRLINPLQAPYSMQSIFHPAYGDNHQQAAYNLNQPHSVVFKGDGGEIERRPEATCTTKFVHNGEMHEIEWPKMVEGRQPEDDMANIGLLTAVWRGEREPDYGMNAVIGTMAIALMLMERASTQQDALELAKTLWQQRNRQRI